MSIEAAIEAAGARLTGVRVFDLGAGAIALDPDADCLFVGIGDMAAAAALAEKLRAAYPTDHGVTVISRPGSAGQQTQVATIGSLPDAPQMPPPMAWFVPTAPAEARNTLDGLRAIMARLRADDGCPWDREQDHRTLRRCLLEEAHEVIAAIDREDWQELATELGDVLLQVLFHAQLASERGEFDFDEVSGRLRKKLVARHPHVFGDVVAKDAADVLRRWDELKRHEAGEDSGGDLLAGVAPTLPALDRAQKVQRRAAHVGFDWTRVEGPLAKLAEEIGELTAALASEGPGSARLEHEVGDILFSVVNVSRFAGIDAEQALRVAADRFAARFATMQELAAEQGERLERMNLDQMDALWERAKERDQGAGSGE
jgi:tetrapyrrole methylase family protein/MazG family protein